MPIAKIHLNLKEVQHRVHRDVDMILDFIQKIEGEPLSETQRERLELSKNLLQVLRAFPNHLSQPDACVNPYKKGPYVLLVEDNEMLQLLHRDMLMQLGCTVDIAVNGFEALQYADQGYDFIFMDIGLPDKSGIEVTKELRAREEAQKLKIIALTAHGKDIEASCLAAGMESIIHKPVDLKTLKALIDAKL